MPKHKLELEQISVVLRGAFNPKIFHPLWFSANQLLRPAEAEGAEIEIFHAEVVRFSLPWLIFEVTRDSLQVVTSQSTQMDLLRDVVVGTFKLLVHTPVAMMGINLLREYTTQSEDVWHAFGHKIAPKELWKDLLTNPGLRRLDMQGQRPDGRKGSILVTVQPSSKHRPGLSFHMNDHYEFEDSEHKKGCEEMTQTLSDSWQISIERSATAIDTLLERT